MSKIFKVPFAATGDKESVPTSTQPDGKVSYEQGFGHDYQKPYEDPEAKDIAREDFNQILFDITDAIGEAQVHGVSKWDDEGRPYPMNALVYHNEKVWQSKVNNNNATPSEGANWSEINISDLAKGVDVPLAGTGLERVGRDFRVKYGTSSGTAVEGSTRVNGKALSGNVSINKADVGLGNVTNDTQAKAQTEIKAGAGLTGGGTLATNRTISVKFGTGSDDVARGNDSRITGALQKSQNLSDLASKSAARGNLGLGTAATRNVGTSTGNVMEVGAFGLGAGRNHLDEFSADTPNGFYRFHSNSTNPPSGVALPAAGVVSGATGAPINIGLFVSQNGDFNVLVKEAGQVSRYSVHHTDNFPPIGYCYTQYHGTETPSTLFGGTWTLLFNTEGVFFRTEGGNASAFGGGIQEDQFRSHTHSYTASDFDGDTTRGPGSDSITHGTRATGAAGGNETRPRNRTVRVWRKTAH